MRPSNARRLPRGSAVLAAVAFLALVGNVDGQCSCSGRGTCGPTLKCSCFAGYVGPDCSGRVCPYGRAWSGKGGHVWMECSNAGRCDRTTGQCECLPGFTGDACSAVPCPRMCSRSGTCVSTAVLARTLARQGFHSVTSGAPTLRYDNWDANATHACVCDAGYAGPDCSAGTSALK